MILKAIYQGRRAEITKEAAFSRHLIKIADR